MSAKKKNAVKRPPTEWSRTTTHKFGTKTLLLELSIHQECLDSVLCSPFTEVCDVDTKYVCMPGLTDCGFCTNLTCFDDSKRMLIDFRPLPDLKELAKQLTQLIDKINEIEKPR